MNVNAPKILTMAVAAGIAVVGFLASQGGIDVAVISDNSDALQLAGFILLAAGCLIPGL